MNTEERRTLQRELGRLDIREAENVDQRTHFLPLWTHRMALRTDVVVVRGGRGVGKSALFGLVRALRTPEAVRSFFRADDLFGGQEVPNAQWLDAYSQNAAAHPEEGVLQQYAEGVDDLALRAVWMGHLLVRVVDENPDLEADGPLVPAALRAAVAQAGVSNVATWGAVALREIGTVSAALDRLELALARAGRTVFAAYDHLDRIGALAPDVRRRYVRALLALWLSLSNRYRALRAKVFLREDLFDAGHLAFPDATKLRPRSASLDWSVEDLYRVVVRHMAQQSERMRAWLARVDGLTLEERPPFGWMPGPMPEPVQKAFVDRLAGELMGAGVKKGYTYRWIPNRLQDAQVHIVPRSILTLIGAAHESALARGFPEESPRLLAPDDLVRALERTSAQRVAEIKEEYGLVRRMENLSGAQVMLDPREAADRLGRPLPDDPLPASTEGGAVMEELVRLGVLRARPDGRIDVPDIYRYGFGIKRKGGVARPK